jgi:hypothetical protein
MEIFTLTSTYVVLETSEVNVCLRPTNVLISDKICTYRVYADESMALSQIPGFITEMTPILFNDFQNMESVSSTIKSNFTV